MDLGIMQVILLVIVTFIAAIDQFSFLESLYQPIVLGPIVGWILGDATTGLVVGGTYQLISIGSMPIGGAQPPNVVIGGIMATVFAISSGMDPEAAVGAAVPFALMGQYAVTVTFSLMSGLMAKADQAAEDANPEGIEQVNLIGMLIIGSLFSVVVLIGVFSGHLIGDKLMQLSERFSWIMAGLSVAGGMMRYVGFATLMNIMLSSEYWGIFFAGFAAATIIQNIPAIAGSTLLLIAFIGVAIALFDYQIHIRMKEIESSGGMSDGI